MERRFCKQPVKLEERADDQPPAIKGYGAVFYDGTPDTEYVLWEDDDDRCVERVMPGAFDKAMSRKDDVRGLFNHDPNLLLGRTSAETMKLSVDSTGLAYEISPGDTTIAKDLQEHLKRGDVTGSSYAYSVDEQRWTETTDAGKTNSVREILDVTLYDVSPCTYPAYEGTTAAFRSAGGIDEARAALKLYRDGKKAEGGQLKAKLAQYSVRTRIVELSESA